MKKKFKIVIVISVFLIICISFAIYSSLPQKVSKSVYEFDGYGILLNNPDGSFHNSFVIEAKDNNDFNYSIKFINNSGKEGSFILLVSLNYKQIPIYIQEGTEKVDNYEFNLEAGKEKIIPIHFPIKNLSFEHNVLVFSVVAGPDKHASELDAMTNFYGTTARYNLITNNKIDEKRDYIPETVDITFPSQGNFNGIVLNKDDVYISKIRVPPLKINVKKNKKVTLFLRAGGYSDTEKYLAWITTGWKQTPLDENKDFYYFKVPKGSAAFKKISFVAPEEKGLYDVCAFLSANPFKRLDDGFFENISIDTSYRFTLNVE